MSRAEARRVVATLCYTGLSASFLQTMTVPLIPAFPHLLGTTPQNASWIVTATLLSGAISAPLSGRAADLYGHRRVLLILIGLMTVGSFLIACSTSVIPVVIGRTLQGVLLAVVPIGASIVREAVPPRDLPRALSTLSATLGIGGAVGLPLAAQIADLAGWRSLFVIMGVQGIASAIVCARVLPEPTRHPSDPMDLLGGIGLAAALACLFLSLQKYVDRSWSGLECALVAAVGAALLIAWTLYELRCTSPIVDLRVDLRGPLLRVNAGAAATGFGLIATVFVMPVLLRAPIDAPVGFGMNPLTASICLMPTGICMMLSSPVAAGVIMRYGARTSLAAGLCLIIIGDSLAAVSLASLPALIVATGVTGLGIGAAYGSLPSLVMAEVHPTRTASANSVNALARSAGSSLGSAVIGTVLAQGAAVASGVLVPTVEAARLTLLIGAAGAAMGLAAIARLTTKA